jgi:hypothetical protein
MQFKTCLRSSGVGSAPGNALNSLGPICVDGHSICPAPPSPIHVTLVLAQIVPAGFSGIISTCTTDNSGNPVNYISHLALSTVVDRFRTH